MSLQTDRAYVKGKLQVDPDGNGHIIKMGLFNTLEIRNYLDSAYANCRGLNFVGTYLQCQQLIEGFGSTDLIFKSNGVGFGFDFRYQTDATLFNIGSNGDLKQKSLTYGGSNVKKKYEAELDLSTGSTIQVNVPANTIIEGVQFVVKTIITGTGAATWTASFTGGSLAEICTGKAFAKNTKSDHPMVGVYVTSETDISILPNAGSLDTGEIVAVVHVRELESLDSFA